MDAKLRAIKIIQACMDAIVYESEDDEGAMDWQGQLEHVRDQLKSDKMTIEEAASDLGINL